MKRKTRPDELRGTLEFQMFYRGLDKTSETCKRIAACLDAMRENVAAGEKIERELFPDVYVRQYGITNLYRLAIDRRIRLVYTIMAEGSKKVVCVLEYFPGHKEYDRRFGYSS